MIDSALRNNAYWLRRLEKDGRNDLLKMIEDKDISVYRATVAAGYRKTRKAASRADQISYHYSRASSAEKRRFIIDNWQSLAPLVGALAKQVRSANEAQKSHEEGGK